MRTGPISFLGAGLLLSAAVTIPACGPPPIDPTEDAGLPPITAEDAGTTDAGPCPRVGLTLAELRSKCGEPCWTNERTYEPATQALYDCEGAGGTCVNLDAGVATAVGWCTP
jgi:hypothetical protein